MDQTASATEGKASPDVLGRRVAAVRLLGLDIDGCLTDGLLSWAGPEVGWTQRYAVRDGEAILRLVASGMPVVPISRNKTACARARMAHLRLPCDWVGVGEKGPALAEVCARYGVRADEVAYLGDGPEDVVLFAQAALACAPPDAHPAARAAGGRGAAEELIDLLLGR